MNKLVEPHGSYSILPRLLQGEALIHAKEAASNLPRLKLSSREFGDLLMMGIGGFTPLDGFMNHDDWKQVCSDFQLANGLFWPIPITLSAEQSFADTIKLGQKVALIHPQSEEIVGTILVNDKYVIDKTFESQNIYQTVDEQHPGVKMLFQQKDVNIGGEVRVFTEGCYPENFASTYLTPKQTREKFSELGWSRIAAFQTRNPMHRSHEYLVKIAVEICDGVLVHSLLGNLKEGDIPADVRTEAIKALIDNYFVAGTVLQSGYPLDMRYAGPREALLHALFRQNYGCTDLIIGRDHAGVGDYYGPFDAQKIFDEIPKDALKIKPLKIDWTFWCDACGSMASMKTCPHDAHHRALLSGTKLRNALANDTPIHENFSRKEVLSILRSYYQSLKSQ